MAIGSKKSGNKEAAMLRFVAFQCFLQYSMVRGVVTSSSNKPDVLHIEPSTISATVLQAGSILLSIVL